MMSVTQNIRSVANSNILGIVNHSVHLSGSSRKQSQNIGSNRHSNNSNTDGQHQNRPSIERNDPKPIFKSQSGQHSRTNSKRDRSNRQSMGSYSQYRNNSNSGVNQPSASSHKNATGYLNQTQSQLHSSGTSNQKNRSASRTSGQSASSGLVNGKNTNFNVIHSKLYEQQQTIQKQIEKEKKYIDKIKAQKVENKKLIVLLKESENLLY
jgi:hypothetical protein